MNITLPIKRLFLSFVFLLPGTLHADEFSIVLIPDTQMYTEAYPQIFEAQVDWIKANHVAENIIYVAHLGDLKDDLACSNKNITVGTGGNRTEWEIVDDTFTDLETTGVAYGVVPGNHDYESIDQTDGDGNPILDSGGNPRQQCPNGQAPNALTTYNQILGPQRFATAPFYGDPGVRLGNRVTNSNEDNFTLFSFGDTKFIAINLAYKQAANPEISGVPQQPELDWADALLKAYPDRIGIITSHYFINDNPLVGAVNSDGIPRPRDNFGAYGQEVYTALSDNRNLWLMTSAHEFGEAWRVETRAGILNPVHGLLNDYQRVEYPKTKFPDPGPIDYTDLHGGKSLGDSGFMRIMRFDTVTGVVSVESFAPTVPSMSRTSIIPGTTYHLVSDVTVTSGDDMSANTVSNLSLSFLDYAEDTTPAAFSFTDQTDIATSTSISSNTIAVTGINADTDISITGGEYSIDGGAFTSAAGTITSSSVSLSQTVQVRQTSSASFSTQTDSVLTIGGVSDTFSVTTEAAPVSTVYIANVTASSTLSTIDVSSGATTVIGSSGVTLTDLAFFEGRLLGVSFSQLFELNTTTGLATLIGTINAGSVNSLVANGSVLYGATTGTGQFITINPVTGAGTVVSSLGSGVSSSGDMVFDATSGNILATVKVSGDSIDRLASINPSTGAVTIIGATGFVNVYGLAFTGGQLIGITSSGQVISINTATGVGTLIVVSAGASGTGGAAVN